MAEHGGRIVAKALKSRGVSHLFTLSGGHLFSIYDGCKEEGIEIVDVRHEQTAAFAAEGFAKATRGVGVAALTAGPGRHQRDQRDRRRPGQRLAGLRARRPGAGDALGLGLAAGDRPPALRLAAGQVGGDGQGARRGSRRRTAAALDLALAAPERARPSSTIRSTSSSPRPRPRSRRARRRRGAAGRRASRRRRRCWPRAERPAIMAGTGLYWGRGEEELRALAEALGIPVFLNGLGRGCLPADHELAFSRARGAGAEGRRRGAGRRRADRLPARLRRQLRRGDEDRPPRRRRPTR